MPSIVIIRAPNSTPGQNELYIVISQLKGHKRTKKPRLDDVLWRITISEVSNTPLYPYLLNQIWGSNDVILNEEFNPQLLSDSVFIFEILEFYIYS